MDRRSSLKTLMLGSLAPQAVWRENTGTEGEQLPRSPAKSNGLKSRSLIERSAPYHSRWQSLPDMIWTGEELWAQRLQDWGIRQGKLTCMFGGPDRTVHLLTHQLSDQPEAFQTEVIVKLMQDPARGMRENFAGFQLGVKGKDEDYRSAVITGNGLNAGVHTDGSIFIGQTAGMKSVPVAELKKGIRLQLTATPEQGQFVLELKTFTAKGNKELVTVKAVGITNEKLVGNIALISHFAEYEGQEEEATVSFADWKLEGAKVVYRPQQAFGPIYFAQYTLNKGVLKISAQLAPLDIPGQQAVLELKKNGKWDKAAAVEIHSQARVATFRVENWKYTQPVPYRARLDLPLRKGRSTTYYYEGTIAAEPVAQDKIKALVLSCNGDPGFPHAEVVTNASRHQADLVLFLGDQHC